MWACKPASGSMGASLASSGRPLDSSAPSHALPLHTAHAALFCRAGLSAAAERNVPQSCGLGTEMGRQVRSCRTPRTLCTTLCTTMCMPAEPLRFARMPRMAESTAAEFVAAVTAAARRAATGQRNRR